TQKDCEHLYEIQLIDYGRTDIVPWNSVTGLPKQFATVQPLAYKCSVGGIMPVLGSMWGCRAIQMFKDLLGGPGKDVLVEMTLLECGKQDKRQWPQVFERKPYIVDINMIDENLNYVSNIAHELSFGSWNTTCAVLLELFRGFSIEFVV
ncbi:Tudor domain-containing protein 15, partial [Orchesella cincta]